MNEQLQQEAMALHNALAAAYWHEDFKRNATGHLCGDRNRMLRLERLAALAADRWRRRMGYEWRRVPAGVRGSRGVQS